MDTFLSAQEFQNSGRKVPIENFVVKSSKRISYLGFNYRLLPIDDCDQEKLKSRTFNPHLNTGTQKNKNYQRTESIFAAKGNSHSFRKSSSSIQTRVTPPAYHSFSFTYSVRGRRIQIRSSPSHIFHRTRRVISKIVERNS